MRATQRGNCRSIAIRFRFRRRSGANPNNSYRQRQASSEGAGNCQCKRNDQIFLAVQVVNRHVAYSPHG